jgi:hypothetical protein
MIIKVPKQFIYDFCSRLLRQIGMESGDIEADIDAFIYESGEKFWEFWEEYEDDDGHMFYLIDFDNF